MFVEFKAFVVTKPQDADSCEKNRTENMTRTFKGRDALDLRDNFHLNVLDCSTQNVISLGLGRSVYIYEYYASTRQAKKLCDVSGDGNFVTSVGWNGQGALLSVGTLSGCVQVWAVGVGRRIKTTRGHSARAGALSWNGDIVSSGSRDGLILQRDVKEPSPAVER
jgi:cell division cycle 20-like protein 1 (cofactor of APC complex)